jgi:hypothetical protein
MLVSNVTFSDQISPIGKGLGVSCENCGPGTIIIDNSIFKNLTANTGSAIYLKD